jgi:hypothetical protein
LQPCPSQDRSHLLARCEPVELALSDVLHESGERIRHVYFPTGSFISLITPTGGHDRMEVRLVGDEGMLAPRWVLGVNIAQTLALVQGAGAAWRMDAERFRRELQHSGALHRGLKRYIYVVMVPAGRRRPCAPAFMSLRRGLPAGC